MNACESPRKSSEDMPTKSPDSSRQSAARIPTLPLVIIALALMFFFVLRSLALPLVLAAVAALLAYPLQEWLARRMGGIAWLAAAILTLLFVLVIACPLLPAVTIAYGELHGLLKEAEPASAGGNLLFKDGRRLRPGIEWVSKMTGVEEDRVHSWVRDGGAELEQALYLRSLRLLGDLPGFAIGMGVYLVALFFFLKDGPHMVSAWEDITPLDDRDERLIHRELIRVCRGLVWSTLAAASVQGIAFGLGLFVLDRVARTGVGHSIILLSLLTFVCSPLPVLGSATVWGSTAVVLFLQGHHAAALVLAIYGAAVVSQVDTVVRVWVLKDSVRMHPLLVFVSILGGIQVLGILGLVVGPTTAAVLFALLRAMRKERAAPGAGPPVAKIVELAAPV